MVRRSKQRQDKTKVNRSNKSKEIRTEAEDQNKGNEIKTKARSKQRQDQRRHFVYLSCEVGRRSDVSRSN